MTTTVRFVRQQHEAENASSFYFEPEAPFDYQAGQYLRLTLPHPDPDQRGVSRTFTIASFPSEPLLMHTTRLSTPSSSFKRALARLEPGVELQTSGPSGRFVYTPTEAPAVFITGGIGITPFRSILGDLAARSVRAPITLLYANRTPDIPFRGFLDTLAHDWPELSLAYTVTRPSPEWQGLRGRIDASFIRQHVPDLARSDFFVSGPTPLVQAVRHMLAGLDVDATRVRYEAFPGYDGPEQAAVPGTLPKELRVPGFARDIRPLFRDKDVEEMLFIFDLSLYDDVKSNAQGIYDTLANGSMPCDGAWPDDRIALFRQWMEEGYAP